MFSAVFVFTPNPATNDKACFKLRRKSNVNTASVSVDQLWKPERAMSLCFMCVVWPLGGDSFESGTPRRWDTLLSMYFEYIYISLREC